MNNKQDSNLAIFGTLNELSKNEKEPAPPAKDVPSGTKEKKPSNKAQTSNHKPQSTSRSTNRSIDQSTDPSVNPPIDQRIDTSPILPKPKCFYVTQQQDTNVEDAVRALKEHPRVQEGVQARRLAVPDRSLLMRLYLEDLDPADSELINRLVDRLIDASTGPGYRG